jgi:hypothetical protein
MARGKLLILAAIVALLISTWWLDLAAPSLEAPRWMGVPLALILALHLFLGYRGFKWIVGAALSLAGMAAACQLLLADSLSAQNRILLVPLCVITLLLGPALCMSRSVDNHLERQRSQRSENVPILLLALWIVVLAVVAVWTWVGVGVQVF